MKLFKSIVAVVLAVSSMAASANMRFTDPTVNAVFTTNDAWTKVNIRNTVNGDYSNWNVTECEQDLISADGLRFNMCFYYSPNVKGKTMMILAYENGNHRIMIMKGRKETYTALFTD